MSLTQSRCCVHLGCVILDVWQVSIDVVAGAEASCRLADTTWYLLLFSSLFSGWISVLVIKHSFDRSF